MNEHEEPKLTSRRERRLQEQFETTGIPIISDELAEEMAGAPTAAAETSATTGAMNISPVDENGNLRTRREMRELREAARRASEAEQVAAETAEADAAEAETPESVVPEAEDASADAEPSAEFDPRLAATEAMTFVDLIEVDSVDAVTVIEDDAEESEQPEPEVPAKSRFRLPWSRKDTGSAVEDEAATVDDAAADDDAVADDGAVADHDAAAEDVDAPISEIDGDEGAAAVLEPVAEVETLVEPEPEPEAASEPEPEEVAEAEVAPAVEVAPEIEAPAVIDTPVVDAPVIDAPVIDAPVIDEDQDEEEDGEVFDAPTPASARTTYSFPDIVPLEEERSVFDDPATQAMPALPTEALVIPVTERTGDFDDLISRAIAAEGATSTNTAALILPAMPEGTDLAGPLGETGELFVTGSIELPKSLGETGGHARMQDSIDFDPMADLGVDLSEEPVPDDSAPVSATRAISARVVEGGGVVAPHTKKGNRLPLILSLTAGGLLLAVIGLLAWGASNGMFG